jgi:hypothetical protein
MLFLAAVSRAEALPTKTAAGAGLRGMAGLVVAPVLVTIVLLGLGTGGEPCGADWAPQAPTASNTANARPATT